MRSTLNISIHALRKTNAVMSDFFRLLFNFQSDLLFNFCGSQLSNRIVFLLADDGPHPD